MNFHHLRYFWAVAHNGNLTRTAQKLNVSQSALSYQIKQLEENLGQQLFERRGKQLILTEAGAVTLDHADVIFAAGEELMDTLLQRDSDRSKALRVGALSTLSRNFQVGFLRPLIDDLEASFSVRSGSLEELVGLLMAQKLDVVLTDQVPQRTIETPWLVHPLAEQPVSLVGPPHLLKPRRHLKTLLRDEPLVIPSAQSSIRIGFDALVVELEVTPKVIAEVDDMALLRLLARQERALAVVPPIVVQGELASGRLVEVQPLPGLSEAFYAITMSRRFPNPALKAVMAAAGKPAQTS